MEQNRNRKKLRSFSSVFIFHLLHCFVRWEKLELREKIGHFLLKTQKKNLTRFYAGKCFEIWEMKSQKLKFVLRKFSLRNFIIWLVTKKSRLKYFFNCFFNVNNCNIRKNCEMLFFSKIWVCSLLSKSIKILHQSQCVSYSRIHLW